MKAFLYGVCLQWKLDIRNKDIIIVYYIVPIVFFMFMGGIFSSINPLAYETLIASMSIFGITMGAYLGTPTPLVHMYASEMKKSYKIGGIPLWAAAVNNFISSCVHLFLMSIIIYMIAPIAFDAAIPENAVIYFISLIMYILVSVSIGTALGLFVKSASKLTMVSQMLFLPFIMLSGIMFPNDLLPDVLQMIGRLFPASWSFEMMQNSSFDIASFWPLCMMFFISLIGIIYRLKKVTKD